VVAGLHPGDIMRPIERFQECENEFCNKLISGEEINIIDLVMLSGQQFVHICSDCLYLLKVELYMNGWKHEKESI